MHRKRVYLKPIVEVVEIDASISLAMESAPPDTGVMVQPVENKNPFDSNPFSPPSKKK